MKPSRLGRRYGWRRGLPSPNARMYMSRSISIISDRPDGIDLRNNYPSITPLDQGQLGSCTANAWKRAFMYDCLLQKIPLVDVSRLMLYYEEMKHDGDLNGGDNGSQISTGAWVLANVGCCEESAMYGANPATVWPYIEANFATQPPPPCYVAAKKNESLKNYKLSHDASQIESCLVQGMGVVIGLTLYESFEDDDVARTGIVPMPGDSEEQIGGHAVCIVGYNRSETFANAPQFIIANSWGTGWGQDGYFVIPYGYVLSQYFCDDLWMAEQVS